MRACDYITVCAPLWLSHSGAKGVGRKGCLKRVVSSHSGFCFAVFTVCSISLLNVDVTAFSSTCSRLSESFLILERLWRTVVVWWDFCSSVWENFTIRPGLVAASSGPLYYSSSSFACSLTKSSSLLTWNFSTRRN